MQTMDTNLVHEPAKTPVKPRGGKYTLKPDLEEALCRRYYVDGDTAIDLLAIFKPLTRYGKLSESAVRLIAKRAWPRVEPTLSEEDRQKAYARGAAA